MVDASNLHDEIREAITQAVRRALGDMSLEVFSVYAETAAAAAQSALDALKRTPYSSQDATILHINLGQISILNKLGVGPNWGGYPDVAEAYRIVFSQYPETYKPGEK